MRGALRWKRVPECWGLKRQEGHPGGHGMGWASVKPFRAGSVYVECCWMAELQPDVKGQGRTRVQK